MIRPSGTEPKIKCYIEVNDKNENNCSKKMAKYTSIFDEVMHLNEKSL